MTSHYSHHSRSNETSLCLSSNGREGIGRVQTVEGLLDAFKRVAAEKGIDLCGIRLSCGELERELTFAETGTGDTYEVNIHLLARKRSRFEQPARSVTTTPVIEGLVSASESMADVRAEIDVAAGCNSTVLITGESGTGKELVARAIHDRSRRLKGPFIPVNCSSLTESLLEAELFGYVKGAFTGASADRKGLFEAANGGTIFLDEIGAATLHTQQCLLRVLQEHKNRPLGAHQEREVDVRVIAATNRDLPREIERGRFCFDLFQRLKVLSIHIPSLRDRPSDIPLLIDHFLEVMRSRHGYLRRPQIRGEAIDLLCNYSWPGNVRELEAMIESLSARVGDGGCISYAQTRREIARFECEAAGNGGTITAESDPDTILESMSSAEVIRYTVEWSIGEPIKEHTRRRDLAFCERVLELADSNYSKAAEWLGMGCEALYSRMYRLRRQVAQSDNRKY